MRPLDPMFDQRIADWLEGDSDRAPGAILATVVAAVPSIPQRRRPVIRLGPQGRSGRFVLIAAIVVLAIVGLALLMSVGRSRFPFFPSPSQHAVVSSPTATRTPRPKPSPTVSPLLSNGLIVFEHFQANLGTRIEVLQPNGLGKELLPTVKGDQEGPAWSPDGTRLAFAGRDSRDPASRVSIWETDAIGSAPRLVSTPCEPPDCKEERAPSYSSDGTKLVFVRSAGPVDGPPTSTVIAIRDLATSDVTVLGSTRTPGADGFLDHPTLSPDGRSVVYARIVVSPEGRALDGVILIAPVEGGKPATLTQQGYEAGDPSWSPDGTRILFAREPFRYWLHGFGSTGEDWVYAMAADGSDVVKLSEPGSKLEGLGSPSWTAGGAQILLVTAPVDAITTPDIQVMAPDGTSRQTVARFGDCCRWYPAQQPTP